MTEDTVTSSRRWSIRDGARKIEFRGSLLAESSSQRPKKPRWSELKLYRTDGGTYIVERNGRTTVDGELDYLHAYVCLTATAVLETLYTRDEDSAFYLTNMARAVLAKASKQDPNIRDAYYTEDVR
jgi:hypothetical protein